MNTSEDDKHQLDPYVKKLGDRKLVIAFSCLMALTGIALSIGLNEWSWFYRFRSLITIGGLFLISSPIFDRGIYLSQSSLGIMAELNKRGAIKQTTAQDKAQGKKYLPG